MMNRCERDQSAIDSGHKPALSANRRAKKTKLSPDVLADPDQMKQMKRQAQEARLQTSLKQASTRVDEIQSWLGLAESTTEAYRKLALGMVRWAWNGLVTGELPIDDVANLFPVVWRRYLAHAKLDDRVVVELAREPPAVFTASAAGGGGGEA